MSVTNTFLLALQAAGLPVAYSHFKTVQAPPYIVYMGDGQTIFPASDSVYHKSELYRAEYYFKKKDPATEDLIETKLSDNGFIYEKSEDVWIEDEGVFVIYYYV